MNNRTSHAGTGTGTVQTGDIIVTVQKRTKKLALTSPYFNAPRTYGARLEVNF